MRKGRNRRERWRRREIEGKDLETEKYRRKIEKEGNVGLGERIEGKIKRKTGKRKREGKRYKGKD